MDLVERHHVSRIDLLQCDVEGYDFDIIKLVDFQKIRPAIIQFEYNKIRNPQSAVDELAMCLAFLRDHHYEIIDSSHCDKIAWTEAKQM